jgi:hypothetical protein
MSQFTLGLFAAVAVFSSCGVEKSVPNQALEPVSNSLPNTPDSGPVTMADPGVVQSQPSTDAGVFIAPFRDAGTPVVDAGMLTQPHINQAERIWKAQENAWRMSVELRASYGQNMVNWLALAGQLAGRPVYSGTLTETAPDVFAYAEGGETLKAVRLNGRRFEWKVKSIFGDVRSDGFPRGDEYLEGSWLWPGGIQSTCNLREKRSSFEGSFADDKDDEFVANLVESRTSSVDHGGSGTNFYVETSGSISYSGTLTYADRVITVDTSVVYSTCGGGGCGSNDAQDYIYTHSPKLTLEGESYLFLYHTGWTKQFAYSLPTYRWDGYFTGARDGSLVRTPIANAAESLEVVVGSDRYFTLGVARP